MESDPTYGMAWYNKACFQSLLNQVPESLESLKRSIEIDVKNARKSMRDRDFLHVRSEEGFKRIEEVVEQRMWFVLRENQLICQK